MYNWLGAVLSLMLSVGMGVMEAIVATQSNIGISADTGPPICTAMAIFQQAKWRLFTGW